MANVGSISVTRPMEAIMANIIIALAILVMAAIAIFKINNKTDI